MRKLLLLSAAALALLAAPAFAQQDRGDRSGPPRAMSAEHPDRNPNHGNMGGMRGPQAAPRQQAAPQAAPQPQANTGGMRGGNARGGNNDRRGGMQQAAPQAAPQQPNTATMQRNDRSYRDNDRGRGNDRRGDDNRYDNDRRGDNNRFDGRDNRPRVTDFRSYHRNFTAPQRYRGPAYRRPVGWYSHRWTYGERLPASFFVRSYWIDDFFRFGLIDPPFGTVWVRYGSDALLIDRFTGEVIQVAYRVFY